MKTFFRDTCIALMVVSVGLMLLWAGNSNYLDYMMAALVLLVPVCAFFFLSGNWPKADYDN